MEANHNHQKKIALINDLSGFGRCSITVSLPIISQMKIQCCPLPTGILSNHTGFESFFFDDYTENMQPYIDEWKKLGLSFSGICSGFLGSEKQIGIVADFFRSFKGPKTIIVVDPVMGDYGSPYATYTPEMCRQMRRLVTYADIITPNLTEACILTDMPYRKDEHWTLSYVTEMAKRLYEMGPGHVVITGIPQGSFIANLCFEGDGAIICRTKRAGAQRSGTGDIFSSIITGDAVNQVPFVKSVKKASQFIGKCIKRSIELDIPLTDGVCFEELLYTLH